jgi:hypothetical protein
MLFTHITLYSSSIPKHYSYTHVTVLQVQSIKLWVSTLIPTLPTLPPVQESSSVSTHLRSRKRGTPAQLGQTEFWQLAEMNKNMQEKNSPEAEHVCGQS